MHAFRKKMQATSAVRHFGGRSGTIHNWQCHPSPISLAVSGIERSTEQSLPNITVIETPYRTRHHCDDRPSWRRWPRPKRRNETIRRRAGSRQTSIHIAAAISHRRAEGWAALGYSPPTARERSAVSGALAGAMTGGAGTRYICV